MAINLLNVLGLLRISYTKNPQESAALGYVNAGTDKRITGELGKLLGQAQSASAYKSPNMPVKGEVKRVGNVYLQTEHDPDNPQNARYAVAIRKSNGRWFTLRLGYVYDPNWGDQNVQGYNPNPEIVGGYFLDVILKGDSDRPFINING